MTALTEDTVWVNDLRRIETTDPVLGGEDGPLNAQGKALGSRTKYLKNQIETRNLSNIMAVGADAGGRVLTGLGAPVASTDAARKGDVDACAHAMAIVRWTTAGSGVFLKASYAWATRIRVRLRGSGGGGGGGGFDAGTGGAGGGSGREVIWEGLFSDLPASVALVIGAAVNGGAGRTSTGNATAGANGNPSSFGAMVAGGGQGGQAAGVGGSGEGGGGAGGNSTNTTLGGAGVTQANGSPSVSGPPGAGAGHSALSPGITGGGAATSANTTGYGGPAATGYGAGGSGGGTGYNGATTSWRAGGGGACGYSPDPVTPTPSTLAGGNASVTRGGDGSASLQGCIEIALW